MNKELVETLVKLIIGCAVIMSLIAAACLITPKIAAFIAKKFPKLDENSQNNEEDEQTAENYKVNDPYGSSKLEDFDPNYKIYNKDIYGVDFKHGKKQKNG